MEQEHFFSQMPYSHHKKHKSLHSEIKHVVEEELKEVTELKRGLFYGDLSGGSLDNNGYYVDLSTLVQGTTVDSNSKRVGDVVSAKTIRIRLQIQGQAPTAATATWKDGAALLRYIIFSWAPYEEYATFAGSSSGIILDLSQTTAPGYEVLAPYVTQGLKQQFKVHVDETIPLYAAAGGLNHTGAAANYVWWPRMEFREHHIHLNHIIDYTGSTNGTIGAGKVYMLVLSNETDTAVTPSLIYSSMLYFTDS